MTVIAYRDGIMAADTLITEGSTALGQMIKIRRNSAGLIGGACGDTAFCVQLLDWIEACGSGEVEMPTFNKTREDQGFNCLMVFPSGRMRRVDVEGYYDFTGGYAAIGSGTDFALGAMACGATAEQAVRAAMLHDMYCGGDVTTLRVGNE